MYGAPPPAEPAAYPPQNAPGAPPGTPSQPPPGYYPARRRLGISLLAIAGIALIVVGFVIAGVGFLWSGASTAHESSCLLSSPGSGSCVTDAINGTGDGQALAGVGFLLSSVGFGLTFYSIVTRVEGVPRFF